jgi:cyclase
LKSSVSNIIGGEVDRTKSFLLILFSLCNGLVIAQKDYADPFKFEFTKIQDDIYVAFRPDHLKQLVEGNSTIIINDRDVIVVDATGSPRGARQIISKIKQLTDKPVRYLINTHGHGDHTLGNQEFVKNYPGCEIISYQETRDYMLAPKGSTGSERGIAYVYEYSTDEGMESRRSYLNNEIELVKKEAKRGYEIILDRLYEYLNHDLEFRRREYMKVTVKPPTLVFENKLTLNRKEREIQVLFIGMGDTKGDIWIYLPKEKIICTGDAVAHPIPFGFSKTPLEWLETLKKVEKMDIKTMIPGHGDIQYNKKYLNMLIELLGSIQMQVKESIAKNFSIEDTYKYVDISKIEDKFTGGDPEKTYYFSGWFKEANIQNTYNELTKENDYE